MEKLVREQTMEGSKDDLERTRFSSQEAVVFRMEGKTLRRLRRKLAAVGWVKKEKSSTGRRKALNATKWIRTEEWARPN